MEVSSPGLGPWIEDHKDAKGHSRHSQSTEEEVRDCGEDSTEGDLSQKGWDFAEPAPAHPSEEPDPCDKDQDPQDYHDYPEIEDGDGD